MTINPPQISVSDRLVAPDDPAWQPAPYLRCPSLTIGQAPTIDQATLIWHFGTMQRESADGYESPLAYVPRLDLVGKFVHVVEEHKNVDWYGYVLSEDLDRGPQETAAGETRLAYGDQTFAAVGLEWFLARETIHSATINDPSAGETVIQRAIGFNAGFGDGRGVTYESRANRDASDSIFADDPTTAVLWTARAAVAYLLEKHGPKDAAGAPSPVTFELSADAAPFLESYAPTVFTEGRSVWQVLNDLIPHSRGLSWRLVPDYGVFFNEFHITLKVTSMSPLGMALPGGGTVPAAPSQVAFTDDDEHARPQIRRDRSHKYDHVVCRGARKRAVFTVSTTSGNLEAGWRSADETDYKTALGADAAVNDRYRQTNRFERVYQVFQIPHDWDGKSNDGGSLPSGTAFACPQIHPESGSILQSEPISVPSLRLLTTMPIKVGYDYASATAPTSRDPANTAAEWQRPFAVVNVGDDEAPRWRFTHELGTTSEDVGDFKSFNLRALESAPAVQFQPPESMPHALALHHFDPAVDGASEHEPLVDFDALRLTVCGEWDAYCEGKHPLPTGAGEPLSTLYLSIGERARHDWLAAGTIYDIDGAGALKTVATGGALRDDRSLCRDLARLAFDWYGLERAQVSIQSTAETITLKPGDLITTIGTGAAQETVNALVSQVMYDFEAGRTSIQAGFAELDFTSLV